MKNLKALFPIQSRFLILRRGLIYSATAVIARLLNLAALSFVLHYAGTEAFGKLSYCLSIASSALIIGACGMDGLLFREMSLRMRQACAWLAHGFALRCATVFLAMGIALILAPRFHSGIDLILLAATCALVFGESLILLGSAWYKARRKPGYDFVNTVGRALLVIVGVLLILPWHPTSRGIAAAYGLGVGLAALSILLGWRKPFRIGWAASLPLPRIIKMGLPFAALDILGNLLGQIPILWLGQNASYAEIGVYTIYMKFLAPFSLLTGHYAQSLQPELALAYQSGRSGLKQYIRNGIWMQMFLGGISSIAVLILGPLVLRWLAHQTDIEWPILLVFACFPFIMGISSLAGACALALNAERKAVWAQASSMAFILLVLNFPKQSPIVWAAGSLNAALLIQALVTWYMVKKALADYGRRFSVPAQA
jgi:O-antigen/teichoic acid export membrane protein